MYHEDIFQLLSLHLNKPASGYDCWGGVAFFFVLFCFIFFCNMVNPKEVTHRGQSYFQALLKKNPR